MEKVTTFLAALDGWRYDESPPSELMHRLDRLFEMVAFSNDDHQSNVHTLLTAFRDTVTGLGGMTMNERLWCFDLMDDWDAASDDGRVAIRRKLEAPE
jgi:hypothetical protein